MNHQPGCPRLQAWDHSEWEAPCACEVNPLGCIPMPLGYRLERLDDHWIWVEIRTERESVVFCDRWMAYRDAVTDSERMVKFPSGDEIA